MKKLLEILSSRFLHPIAVVLAWINIKPGRSDLSGWQKLAWAVLVLIPVVPVRLRADRRRPLREPALLFAAVSEAPSVPSRLPLAKARTALGASYCAESAGRLPGGTRVALVVSKGSRT